MMASADNKNDHAESDDESADVGFAEYVPSPWDEVKKLQYGGDRSFAHVIETQVLTAAPEQRAALEKKLLAALSGKQVTLAAQDFLCRMLVPVASEACVGVVAPLLDSEKTSHLARLVLEPIPGEKVDAVLRGALAKLSGEAKAGLLGTIAVRAMRRKH